MKKMDQIEEANADIAVAMARLDNEEMVHFLPQKSRSRFEDRSAKIKRVGYSLPSKEAIATTHIEIKNS